MIGNSYFWSKGRFAQKILFKNLDSLLQGKEEEQIWKKILGQELKAFCPNCGEELTCSEILLEYSAEVVLSSQKFMSATQFVEPKIKISLECPNCKTSVEGEAWKMGVETDGLIFSDFLVYRVTPLNKK